MELKKCPFCGQSANIVGSKDHKVFEALCTNCFASSRVFETEEEAASAWNQRTKTWKTRLDSALPNNHVGEKNWNYVCPSFFFERRYLADGVVYITQKDVLR